MALTPKWGIYSDDPSALALGNRQDTLQAQSIENALNQVVEEASFIKTQLLGEDLTGDAVSDGVYTATNTVTAAAAGMPDNYPGILMSYPVGSLGGYQMYVSLRGGSWERNKVGGVWGAWSKTGNPAPTVLTVQSSLDDVTDALSVVTNTSVASSLGAPDAYPGVLSFTPVGPKGGLQVFSSLRGGSWRRTKVNNVWGPWDSGGASAAPGVGGGREILRQGLTARKGGVIGTAGRGAIALRFDDYPVDFREKALPLLEERGLPFTRVSTSERINQTIIEPAEFTAMQDYCLRAGGEVWNHGRTHLNASGVEIGPEIVGALESLRVAMPRLAVDCFAPPGGSLISFDGHMPSTSASSWDTTAGALILSHHALASGYLQDSYYRPIDGVLRDGQNHYSVDAYTYARAKQLIDRARDWGVGVVLMWHMNRPGTDGYMGIGEFEQVLDYIVAERDAGRIVVLTKSGLGVADKKSSYRDNLLTESSGTPFFEAVPYPQYRQGVAGSTRELVATVHGNSGDEVISRIGEFSRVFYIPAGGVLNLRHVVTIPTDVTSLDISISGEVSEVAFYAV